MSPSQSSAACLPVRFGRAGWPGQAAGAWTMSTTPNTIRIGMKRPNAIGTGSGVGVASSARTSCAQTSCGRSANAYAPLPVADNVGAACQRRHSARHAGLRARPLAGPSQSQSRRGGRWSILSVAARSGLGRSSRLLGGRDGGWISRPSRPGRATRRFKPRRPRFPPPAPLSGLLFEAARFAAAQVESAALLVTQDARARE